MSAPTGSTASAGVTQEQIIGALASMTPTQRAELSAALAPPTTPTTPKLSGPIDQVPDGDVARVLSACREGIKLVTDDPAASADRVLAPLLGVSPRLAAAAQANATHRRKDVAHSLNVIVARLGARKR